jgi:hypothetical protein
MTRTSNDIRNLSLDDLDVVTGGTDKSASLHFSFFGMKVGVTSTETPEGTITCTTIRSGSGSSHTCTIS